jgi:hypothetical protein
MSSSGYAIGDKGSSLYALMCVTKLLSRAQEEQVSKPMKVRHIGEFEQARQRLVGDEGRLGPQLSH